MTSDKQHEQTNICKMESNGKKRKTKNETWEKKCEQIDLFLIGQNKRCKGLQNYKEFLKKQLKRMKQ